MPVELSPATRDFLRALASITRQELLLGLADGSERTVSEIAEAADLGVSTVSEHLAMLRQARIVKSRRSGKEVRYSADPDGISASLSALSAFLEACCPTS
jgi:DNA-binding transcriptional ArsR family regulator